jgi:hypothetical protein
MPPSLNQLSPRTLRYGPVTVPLVCSTTLYSASRISSISRPLNGETPTVDLVVGYHKANPILRTFLAKMARNEEQQPKANSYLW